MILELTSDACGRAPCPPFACIASGNYSVKVAIP